MKKLLPVICIIVLLYSCKKDQIPYDSIQGKWRSSRFVYTFKTNGKTTVEADTSTVDVIDFYKPGQATSNEGLGGITYSLKTLKLTYARTGYYEKWDIALPSPDSLVLTTSNLSDTGGVKKVKYYGKVK